MEATVIDSNNTIDRPAEAAAEPKLYHSIEAWMKDQPGNDWREASERLTLWTEERLVNRTDVYRTYKSPERRFLGQLLTYTAPWFEDDRVFGSLDCNVIETHYCGNDVGKLIGVHAISIDNTSRWFAIDVDQHGDAGPVLVEQNLDAALAWYDDLRLLGFRPLLLDANGSGGFHLLVCLSEPASSRRVHDFVWAFVQNYTNFGLKQAPAVFPGEPEVNPHRPYGSWWRLPGRHHTNAHWTRVWGGSRWLEDREAIEAIVSVTGDSPALIPGDGSASGPVARNGDGLVQLARYLLEERLDPDVVAEVCLLWNDIHNQPPSDEQNVRQTVRDLVQRG